MIKKQIPRKVVYKINVYLIKSNITITKLRMAQTQIIRDIIIQITNKKKVMTLKKDNAQIKVLKSKKELA